MHEWIVYRREVTRTPLRTLAAEIGISKSAVDKFYRGKGQPGKNWPRLRDWYMANRQRRTDEYQTPPELTLTSFLHTLGSVPEKTRARMIGRIASVYEAEFTESRLPVPEWVRMAEALAQKEAQYPSADEPDLPLPPSRPE